MTVSTPTSPPAPVGPALTGLKKETRQRTLSGDVWRRFRRHKPALIGAFVLGVIVLLVALAPITAPYSPTDQDLLNRFEPPTWQHWMGTDELGRDMWSRLLYGGRISLTVGLLAMGMAIALGSLVGLLAGFYKGWMDTGLTQLTDAFLSLPRLITLIVLTTFLRAADLPWLRPGSFESIAFIIGLFSWMTVARLVRASTLELREREFVQASHALGVRRRTIIFRHILPNVASPIIVAATLGLAAAIISESGLSYLGFGVQPPTPTWGNMLRNAQSQMLTAPWTAIFPGLMIFVVVIAVNYIGDGLRDALDPKDVR
ncbi:MAG: ABC transporter permease [Caldilineaceae bacterium]